MVQALSQQGYRVTGPRRALVRLIADRKVRFTAADLEEDVARISPAVGRATVFRTLELLLSLGLVERVHTEGERRDAYVVAGGVHHHHLVCSRCGVVTEVTGCMVDDLVSSLAQASGFQVEGHWMEIVGLCSRCRGAGSDE
jgi:Fur family ferric uptake transcriptional regulator